ncbi:amylo-alpha-1,6-glucosidase [Variovorax sp. J22R24]|uniref:amylo-alpha-1,6-glucosidase n=1 Tax=Variovorax gracilis TaxID=3053502 RepID=UPI0025759854|nr:amylo-alpha-1,6-glucosidase [Variovorax sp. J22R24]MDM0108809.1 amylo-alpha-1,6-glucosidase [Variovorax sp. J22R24]
MSETGAAARPTEPSKPAAKNDEWPAPPARSAQRLFVLKEGDTFLVADTYGDITGEGDGLFHNDTRLLSTFRLLMNGQQPSLLSSAVSQDNAFFTAHMVNHPLPPLGESSMPQGVIHLERRRFLWGDGVYERVALANYSDTAARVPLQLLYAADFRDMFEVRGQSRSKRGALSEAQLDDRGVALRYQGLDSVWRTVVVSFSEVPKRLTGVGAEFEVLLRGGGEWALYIEVASARTQPSRQRFRDAAAKTRRSLRTHRRRGARLRVSNRLFQAWIDKSEADLALLTTELPTGPYPYAGIPWFSTPFGRDAVITAMQTLWLDPALARGVLSFLAAHQAIETSTFRDAEPGKIMHETRKGEMAAVNELPFGKYYGGVDTTPLFIMLAAAYAQRTADAAFIDGIWKALVAATSWIENNMSRHAGFVGYARGEHTGLANQGWKDSHDSVFHEDGTSPTGPIALIEVQGYAYAALRGMAALARGRGDEAASVRWDDGASALAARVEQAFWQDDLQFYALALDGHGQACRVRASNAGHLLFSGLPSAERGRLVARQILSGAFDSGWGVRTLPSNMPRFNPMSYHNGSVWPHDVALCAAGVARYGDRSGAVHLLGNLFEAAAYFGLRLPELFCGFKRASGESPIAYPVACLPQAWAAGSVFMLLQSCLGIEIDAHGGNVLVNRPQLPAGIESLGIAGLAVGQDRFDLAFRRVNGGVVAFVEANDASMIARVEMRL